MTELQRMAGRRERCMYCRDSLSCDVEHFAPISIRPDRAFVWSNFLWICGNCNRRKGNRFPTSDDGRPLLIDPTTVEPWEHFILDTATGEISPRWETPESEDQIAVATMMVIGTLGHEAVVNGRYVAIVRLRRAGLRWLSNPNSRELSHDLVREFHDETSGVGQWFTRFEGSGEDPWPEVRNRDPRMWRRLAAISCD